MERPWRIRESLVGKRLTYRLGASCYRLHLKAWSREATTVNYKHIVSTTQAHIRLEHINLSTGVANSPAGSVMASVQRVTMPFAGCCALDTTQNLFAVHWKTNYAYSNVRQGTGGQIHSCCCWCGLLALLVHMQPVWQKAAKPHVALNYKLTGFNSLTTLQFRWARI